MPDLFLLHFDERYAHAQHYLGYAVGTGRGHEYAKAICKGTAIGPHELVMAAQWSGIPIQLAEVWVGAGRALQRRMRSNGSLSRFCPICRESGVYHR